MLGLKRTFAYGGALSILSSDGYLEIVHYAGINYDLYLASHPTCVVIQSSYFYERSAKMVKLYRLICFATVRRFKTHEIMWKVKF